jgi:hypothetical protein
MALIRMHFFIFLIITIVLNQINCQQLTAVKSKSYLGAPRELASSVYDGDDKIYIFGGNNNQQGPLSDFLTYTLSTDTIEIIPDTGYKVEGGEMFRDTDGEIYYGGGWPGNAIMKYNQVNKTWSQVALLSRWTYSFGLLQPSANTAIIVGGQDNPDIVLFNMTGLTTTKVGTLPELPSAVSTVAALYNKDEAIVFQIPPSNQNTSVFKYSLSTRSFSLLSDSFPRLYYPSLVYDGSHVYIVTGGYANTGLYGGFIQVDPFTANWTFIPVNNFLSPNSQRTLPNSL